MKRCLLVTLVLVLMLTSVTFGQFNFDFCGGGARAEGMGKAYLAVSDDVYSASWNPAGLYTIEKSVLGLSWGAFAPRGNSSALSASGLFHSSHSGSYDDLNAITFATPFRVKGHPFVGSLGYTRNCDVFQTMYVRGYLTNFDTLSISASGVEILLVDTQYVDRHYTDFIQGGVNSANFALASRLYGSLSCGLSVNVYGGRALHRTQIVDYIEDVRYNWGLEETSAIQDSSLVDTNKFTGVNFSVGMKFAGEKLSAGFVVRTPFTMRIKWDEAYYKTYTVRGIVVDDRTDTVYIMDKVAEYDLPWIVGVGFGYDLSENLLLAADAQLAAYKGGKIRYRTLITINPGGDNIEEFIEYDPGWQNVLAFRLGGEYLWRTGIGAIPFRAGAGLVPSANPNFDVDGDVSRATTYTASVGTGIHWQQIGFDFAYSVSTLDRHYFGGLDYTFRNHHLNLGFTGVF